MHVAFLSFVVFNVKILLLISKLSLLILPMIFNEASFPETTHTLSDNALLEVLFSDWKKTITFELHYIPLQYRLYYKQKYLFQINLLMVFLFR